ncbi:MAG: hypothetical protein EBR82_17825 [Caulobacteraceae bacterium]|nr:hypothetical protein [Caulobacteraceae bacterium]
MTNHKLCQFIVKKYINKNINWPREIKIAQKLIKKLKEFEFWENLQDLKSSPPSLAWFLKPEGKAFLLKEYEKFKLNLKIEIVKLEKNKVQDDKKICQKPKTLLEFIRYGKKT